MNPIRLEIFLDDKTLAGMRSVEGNFAMMENVTKEIINNLKLQLQDLEKQYKVLQQQGLAGDKEMADIQALQDAIGGLKDRLKEYEAAKKQANETPILENDPAPKLNSVKMSMQQIARELPSLAMGPQMFFLAISNNIPMFTDAVGNARKEYERLTAAGQKAMPVWRQLLKSLISWQTAMAAAITLTVVYGKEIGEWVKGLFGGKTAMDELRESMKKTYEVEKEANATLVKTRFEMDHIIRSIKDFKGSKDEERRKVTELNKTYGEAFGYYQTLSEWYDTLMQKSSDYIQVLVLEQKARKWIDQAAEEGDKADKLKSEGVEKNRPWFGAGGRIHKFFGGGTTNQFGSDPAVIAYNKKLKEIDDAEEEALKRAEEFQNEAKRIREGANISTVITGSVEELENSIAERRKALKKLTNKADYDAAMKIIDEEEKKLEAITGKKDKSSGKTNADYQNELADARIRVQQKIEATRIAIMQEGYEKRKALANKEYKDNLAAIDKEERDTLDKMEKSKKAGKKITPEEVQQVKDNATSLRNLAMVQYLKNAYDIEKEWRDKNQQAWIDYNKEYGTYQEKRLAIAQDYALKIGKAETEGEKASLKKKRNSDLKELDFGEFKNSINLADVFGNLDEQSTDALVALRDKLKKYINNAAKTLKPSDLKELQDAVTNIDLKLKERNPFKELKSSLKDYQQAQDAVEKAQEELNVVLKGGEIITGVYQDTTGKLVKKLLTQEQAEKNLNEAQQKRWKNQTKLAQSLFSAADEMAAYGQAADDVVNMLEGFGVSVDENVKRALEGFNAMSDGIRQFAQSLMSGDIAGMISGVVNTVGGFINTIGSVFGADWGGERSERRYQQAKEKYESYIEVLDKVISKQKELVASMEADDFANADNSYEKARELLKKQQEYAREMGKAYLNAGASKGFLGMGSSASHGVDQRKDISASAWEQAKKALGSDFDKYDIGSGRMTGLFDLTYEQLVKLRDEATGFWSELHEDTQTYLEQIIESEEAWQEVQNTRKEALTKTDFDSFYNGFISMLSDMDATSEDFADSFEKYLQNAIFSALVATQYKDKIQKLYDSWANLAGEDGLSSVDAEKLRGDYQDIVNEMLKEREQLMKDFGWTSSADASSQSGRSGAFTTLTQEQGTKLEGLFTSVQDHLSGMHQLLDDLIQGRIADREIFMQIAENTAYCRLLEDILDILERQDRDGMKLKD
jgi:hypothetical protein|nr:MAG TPA: tail tape measure protein [Caudoviricetes sp.]